VRFAGLTIIDSGSVGGSGSFLYDSVQDEFIFVHRGNGTNVTSSHFVLGPETYDSLGNETYLTTNILSKGTGKEHLVDSCIFDNGTTTCIKNNLVGTGTACFASSTQAGGFYANGSTTITTPFDTTTSKVYFDASCINGATLTLISDSTGRTIRLAATTAATYSGKIDINTSEMNIGTNVALPFTLYTNQCPRITTTSTGITCFSCQVCAPAFVGGTMSGTTIYGSTAVCSPIGLFSGCVGIGTPNPTGRLHLKAPSNDIVLRFEQQNDITSQYYFNIDSTTNGTLSLITNYLGGTVVGFSQNRTGFVGIGTSSPGVKLDVIKEDNSTCAISRFYANNLSQWVEIWYGGIRQNGTGDTVLNLDSKGNAAMVFGTNSTERIRITGTGITCFSCQTCTPFVVTKGIDVSSGGATNPTDACVGYGIFGYSGVGLGITSGATSGNQGIGFFVCGVERGRWIVSGNLGIGTLCPSAKLDVRGGSDGDGMISIGSPSVSGILNSPANVYINADSDNDSSGVIGFGFNRTGYTGGTEVMRILETGKVGIGISNPTRELHIAAPNATLRVGPDYPVLNSSTDRDYIDIIAGGSQSIISAPNESFLIVNTGGGGASPCIDIVAGGSGGVRLTNTATSWAGISDIRAKDIIEPVINAVSKLSNLSIIVYKLKDDITNQRKIGLIAQEVNEVLPEVVDVPMNSCVMWGVRYSEIVPVLVKAIQEQQCTICSQASMINILKTCIGIN
jgi:hypothetical protein